MTSAGEIKAALRPVAEALERMGVPYMVAGSVASSMYGVPRTTLDADLWRGSRDATPGRSSTRSDGISTPMKR